LIPSRDGGRGTGTPQNRLHFCWENIQQKEPKEHTDKQVQKERLKRYSWYTKTNRLGTIGTDGTQGTIGTFILTNNI